jgi:hypothetical protein
MATSLETVQAALESGEREHIRRELAGLSTALLELADQAPTEELWMSLMRGAEVFDSYHFQVFTATYPDGATRQIRAENEEQAWEKACRRRPLAARLFGRGDDAHLPRTLTPTA